MPTYEYLCKTCSHRFETSQKWTDEPLTSCPECGGDIRKVLYPTGIVFKGSGFYKTDHGQSTLVAPNSSNEETKPKTETAETTTTSESSASESSGNSTSASEDSATSEKKVTTATDSKVA